MSILIKTAVSLRTFSLLSALTPTPTLIHAARKKPTMRFAISSTSNMSLSFTPSLIPSLAALAAFALTFYLGAWQQSRADEKRELQASLNSRVNMPALDINEGLALGSDKRYRQAFAIGEYDAAGQLFIDNKSEGMVVGYHVITPLKLRNQNQYVLVNRGFVSRSLSYPLPPAVKVPTGEVEVNGMLVSPTAKFIELGQAGAASSTVSGDVWQNLTIDRYRELTKRSVIDLILLPTQTDPQLKAQTERPDARVAKHVEYMLTFYCLAATVVVLWISLNIKFIRSKSTA
jgi:surfeit locus 1 family protein